MSHLDEGRLLELRDDARADDAEGWSHVDDCPECAGALADARGRVTEIGGALRSLDRPVDLAAARAAVRARVAQHSAREAGAPSIFRTRSRSPVRSLSRAAGLLLVTAAGVAAALPGSPVRRWVTSLVTSEEAALVPPSETTDVAAPSAMDAEDAGIRLDAQGPLRVAIRGLGASEELRVRFVPGSEAAVFAPLGSRFTTGQGRVEADLAAGGVRVDLPAGSTPVTLDVDGVVYLRRGASGLEVPGPAVSRTASEIVFRRAVP